MPSCSAIVVTGSPWACKVWMASEVVTQGACRCWCSASRRCCWTCEHWRRPRYLGGDGPRAGHQRERLGGAGCGGLQRGSLAVEEGLDGFAQIFDQMKPVDHLHGMRCPPAHALGVEGPPVPTDHGDRGMLREPGGHALRRALGQQVQDPVILQGDQDRSIALPAPPRPLITPNALRVGDVRRRGRLPQPQPGVRTGAQPQTGHESCTGLPAEGHATGEQELGEPRRLTRPRSRHGGQTFRENLAWARGGVPEQFPPAELHAYGVGPPRQIGAGACLLAVDPCSLHVAQWAEDTGVRRGHLERDHGSRVIDRPRLQGQRRFIW